MRAVCSPLLNTPAASACSGLANQSTAIVLPCRSNDSDAVPISNQPSAFVSSPQGASGPSSSRSCWRARATATPMNGVKANTIPYTPTAAMPTAPNTAANANRLSPSAPKNEA